MTTELGGCEYHGICESRMSNVPAATSSVRVSLQDALTPSPAVVSVPMLFEAIDSLLHSQMRL